MKLRKNNIAIIFLGLCQVGCSSPNIRTVLIWESGDAIAGHIKLEKEQQENVPQPTLLDRIWPVPETSRQVCPPSVPCVLPPSSGSLDPSARGLRGY